MFFTFDNETTGMVLDAKIDDLNRDFADKHINLTEDLNRINDQHASWQKYFEGKFKMMERKFKMQLDAERETTEKLQLKLEKIKMENSSQKLSNEFIQFLIGILVLFMIVFYLY